MRWIHLAALLAAFAAVTMAKAETIKLKNGTVLQGSIVQMSETDLTLDTADMGRIQIKRRAVQGFEDDPPAAAPLPATAAVPTATPAPATPPTIAINNNNNNNNNNNTASTSAAATAAPAAPPPAAPAPAPVMTAPPPAPTVAQADEPSGIVLGAIGVGMTYLRESTDNLPASWTKPTPVAHWDLIGYRWGNGIDLMLFADGTQQQNDGPTAWQWLQGGLRIDATFGRHVGPLGNGEFYAGAGAAHTMLTTRISNAFAPDADPTSPSATPTSDQSSADGYSLQDMSGGTSGQSTWTQEGTAAVAVLGYRTLSAGGLGLDVALSYSDAHLPTTEVSNSPIYGNPSGPSVHLQTLGLTAGLSYAL